MVVGWGGLFDYSVSPGPVFWEFNTEFWVQSLDLDLDIGLDINLDTGPDLELDNIYQKIIVLGGGPDLHPPYCTFGPQAIFIDI